MNKFAHIERPEDVLYLELLQALESYTAGNKQLQTERVLIVSEATHAPRLMVRHTQGEVTFKVAKTGNAYELTAFRTANGGDVREYKTVATNLLSAVFETMSDIFPPMLLS